MRLIGHLPTEQEAQRFGAFLYARDIANDLDRETDGSWAVWVHDEEKIHSSKDLLDRFKQNPHDAAYKAAEKTAAELRSRAEKELQDHQHKVKNAQQIFPNQRPYRIGTLTTVLIAVSVVVFLGTEMGNNWGRAGFLRISDHYITGDWRERLSGLVEVKKGQVWRLVTPIFLHGSFLHIFFNMWWLKDLGSLIEYRKGWKSMLGLTIIIAILSNVGQFLISGPMFGGMSGVVYGLLGYIWIRGKVDPFSGFYIDKASVVMMLAWLVLCWVGLIPNVANTAHIVGLLSGMALGYLAAKSSTA